MHFPIPTISSTNLIPKPITVPKCWLNVMSCNSIPFISILVNYPKPQSSHHYFHDQDPNPGERKREKEMRRGFYVQETLRIVWGGPTCHLVGLVATRAGATSTASKTQLAATSYVEITAVIERALSIQPVSFSPYQPKTRRERKRRKKFGGGEEHTGINRRAIKRHS